MKTQIFAKHMELTPAITEYIEKNIQKLNDRLIHDRDTVKVTVTLKVEHEKHYCEVVVFFPKRTFVKTIVSDDMYESIKGAFSSVYRENRKHKEKSLDKRHDFIKEMQEDDIIEE